MNQKQPAALRIAAQNRPCTTYCQRQASPVRSFCKRSAMDIGGQACRRCQSQVSKGVPLPLLPQSASPTGAKGAEEHERRGRVPQGCARFQRACPGLDCFALSALLPLRGQGNRHVWFALKLNYQWMTDYYSFPGGGISLVARSATSIYTEDSQPAVSRLGGMTPPAHAQTICALPQTHDHGHGSAEERRERRDHA